MGLADDARRAIRVVRDALALRRASTALRMASRDTAGAPRGHFKIAVYFADGADSLYQVRQWYKPLAELSHTWPTAIIAREPVAARALIDEAPLPTVYARQIADLERFLAEQDIRIVFYVNQSSRNFRMMRYGQRWHVFINHGESDKVYMTSNQVKAYDFALVAGDAALERLGRSLWAYDLRSRAIPIGRPQADHFDEEVPFEPDGRMVVLYAPTWEGDRDGARYSSLASHGVALVEALLATGRHRVIYRPHPKTGTADAAVAAADAAIVRAIEAANAAGGGHVVDRGASVGWQLVAADVAIVDVSAMIYDRLAVGKPLLVARPGPEAELDLAGYLGEAEWLETTDAPRVAARIDEVLGSEASFARLSYWVEHYFGDTTPGAATARFHAAVERLMAEWERWAELSDRSR